MKNLYLIVFLMLFSTMIYGQKKPDNSEIVSEKLVGVWVLDYALYKFHDPLIGVTAKDKGKFFIPIHRTFLGRGRSGSGAMIPKIGMYGRIPETGRSVIREGH